MIKAMALLTTLMVVAPSVSAQKQNRRVEEEIRRVNAEEVQSLLRNDVNALGRIWSDDLIVTNPLNKLVSKQDVLQLIDSGILAFTSYERRIEYIHPYGNLVVVAGSETVIWAGKMPNAGRTSLLRFTGLWLKHHGRWQEVARHANLVS